MKERIPINFLIHNLCNQKSQRNKIMDSLIFMIYNKELYDVNNKESIYSFPPRKLYYSKDSFQHTYYVISLRILLLLSLLIHNPFVIQYFLSGKYPNVKSSHCLNSIQNIRKSLKLDLTNNSPISPLTNLLSNEEFKTSETHLKVLIQFLIDIVQESIEFSTKAISLINDSKIDPIIFDPNSIKSIILKFIEVDKESAIYNEISKLISLITQILQNNKIIFNNLRELIINYSRILNEKSKILIEKVRQNEIEFKFDNSNLELKLCELHIVLTLNLNYQI